MDRLTIERGIPGIILMENAGSRVVDFLQLRFAPLHKQRVLVVCGKGNNGGDGFVIARQLFTRSLVDTLHVVELFDKEELTGDAREARRMLEACGCPVHTGLRDEVHLATILIDAVLGTGLVGPARGPALDAIRVMNERLPLAARIAVDIPSGMPSDGEKAEGPLVKADYTVTFTAPKRSQVFSPDYGAAGELVVVPIGTPAELCETNPAFRLNFTVEADLQSLFTKRPPRLE